MRDSRNVRFWNSIFVEDSSVSRDRGKSLILLENWKHLARANPDSYRFVAPWWVSFPRHGFPFREIHSDDRFPRGHVTWFAPPLRPSKRECKIYGHRADGVPRNSINRYRCHASIFMVTGVGRKKNIEQWIKTGKSRGKKRKIAKQERERTERIAQRKGKNWKAKKNKKDGEEREKR